MKNLVADTGSVTVPLSKQRMFHGWALAIVALTALLMVINYYVFVSLRQQIVTRELSQMLQIANVTASSIDNAIGTVVGALKSIRDNVREDASPKTAHELLKTTAEAAPFIRALAIVKTDGKYIHSSRAYPAPKIDLSKSPIVSYFNSMVGASDSFHITDPTRNVIDSEWQIIAGVPARNADGSINTVIAAVIDTRQIYADLLQRQDNGGSMMLVNGNLLLVAENPWQDELIGKSVSNAAAYKKLAASRGLETADLIEDEETGQPSLAASVWLQQGQFALIATRPLDTVLRDWRVLKDIVAGASLAIFLLLLLTALINIRDSILRRKQSQALQESERQLNIEKERAVESSALQSAVVKNAAYAVIATNSAGVITIFNPAAEQMLGYCASELIGHQTPAVFHDKADFAEKIATTAASGGKPLKTGLSLFNRRLALNDPDIDTWLYVTKSGDRIPVRLSISQLRSADGSDLGFLGIAVDLTEQLRHEAELNDARLSAEQAGAAKADFLANMSHEIRTPLNGIIGYADLALEDKTLSPPSRQHVERIFEASNSLRVIIDDILDFSKIEVRGVELQSHPFNMTQLTDNCTSIVRQKATENGLDVFLHVDDKVPKALLGDAPRLRQVLINLLNNAVKFTAEGSVSLTVTSLSQTPSHQRLRFSITDTGIGISAEDQKKLFQRFNQADGSISRRFGGTGLGLAISKCIVDAMDGELGLQSELGKGSTFSFEIELPIADAESLDPHDAALPVSVRRLRILSVDDVEMNRDLCRAILTRAGHDVTVADSGKAALALIAQKTFDLVLMDVQMPHMDGLEATRQIRALGGDKGKTPIVALTANVMPDQVSRYKAAGMDDHVGKPIARAALLSTLAKWSGQPASLRAAPDAVEITEFDGIPVHDDEMLNELRMLGEPTLISEFVGHLRSTIAAAPTPSPDDAMLLGEREQLAAMAHKAVHLAGQLGFAHLAEAYRNLEAACIGGLPVNPALDGLHNAISLAQPKIDEIATAA